MKKQKKRKRKIKLTLSKQSNKKLVKLMMKARKYTKRWSSVRTNEAEEREEMLFFSMFPFYIFKEFSYFVKYSNIIEQAFSALVARNVDRTFLI